jgi:basic amino acid/polyamine antiporter, APA family
MDEGAGAEPQNSRTIGLVGATGVGVGAIVGGGLFVLAGIAYAEAGPAATLAFALNAVLAFAAAFSFAELATRFPENGGTYAFAKRVLSVRSAFAAGWVLWFAHIVTAVLYALGFATFTVIGLVELLLVFDRPAPSWLVGRNFHILLGAGATTGYALAMVRRIGGGGQWANAGKVLVFVVIIVAGLVALVQQPAEQTVAALTPFLPGGASGLLAAMGFTFISLQGVGLIAAVGGEVREPTRNLPRAMFTSLAIAVALYVPLVLLVSVVGVAPDQSIVELAEQDRDGAFATGVRAFMGDAGYWFVIIAAFLSTLSALDANLLAGSRVALSMANDRLLPSAFASVHAARRTPVISIAATGLAIVSVLFMVSDLAAAGAAAGLIFLITYLVTHYMAYLLRRRERDTPGTFRAPLFPLIPFAGMASAAAIAVFQAVNVPDAGGLMVLWLGLGVLLYVVLFRSGAETADEYAEALDPTLGRLRGKSPLVLVPVANPAHARAMVEIANALAPSEYARVLLLTIVPPPRSTSEGPLARLEDAQLVVREALEESYAAGHAPVAMISAAPPWEEIRRTALEHGCQSLLLGLGASGPDEKGPRELEDLINQVDADVALFRGKPDWRLANARRILVPVGGRGEHNALRARLLGSICRDVDREVTFATVQGAAISDDQATSDERDLRRFAAATHAGEFSVTVLRGDDPGRALIDAAADYDLIILGLRVGTWGRREVGDMVLRIAREVPCAASILVRRRAAIW